MDVVLKKPAKSARKAKGDGHLRRAEILHAAEAIFVRDGYDGATIRKIADEVGVSSTALYMHFRDKDQILTEICEGAVATLLSINTEISSRPIDPASRVRLMLESYVQFGLENPNAYLLVFCGSNAANAYKSEAAVDLGRQTYERFRGAVADLATEGRLRHGDADGAVQVLWMASHGLVSLRITRPDFEWVTAQAQTAVMLDSLMQGLLTD